MNWKRIFDSVGLNGTWWQWRILAMQERWKNIRSDASTRVSQMGYEHRICRNCGGLIDRDIKVCPRCGERLEHFRAAQFRRAVGLIAPDGFTVAYLLIAVNICSMAAFMLAFGGMNLLAADGRDLAMAGMLIPQLFWAGEWWRLIMYAYLHGGILHILFNMMSLSQVGPVAEREVGPARFFVLFTLCAIGGGAADLFASANGLPRHVVGASGAIFGLIGFGLTFNWSYGGAAGRSNSKIFLQWALYSFAYGMIIPQVDNICHAGGFLTGALLGIVMERTMRNGDPFAGLWRVLAVICALATLASFAAAILYNVSV